jgi:hypothetical protein
MAMELHELKAGDRVQLHPASTLWMQGARFGQVVSLGRKFAHVKLDRREGVFPVHPRNISEVL